MCLFWWVELDLFSLECNEVSSSGLWGVSGLGMALGSMSFNAQGCVPALRENEHGMSCTGTCWLLGRAWFQCRYGGFWVFLSFTIPWNQEFSDVLKFWS